jgi:hypothetical protein
MDPDETLREVLEALALRERSTNDEERATLAIVVCVGLTSLRDWTYQGGYPPSWPQGPLTQEQVNELTRAGHQP